MKGARMLDRSVVLLYLDGDEIMGAYVLDSQATANEVLAEDRVKRPETQGFRAAIVPLAGLMLKEDAPAPAGWTLSPAEYVKAGGGTCPKCCGDETAGGDLVYEDGETSQKVSCDICGAAWWDIYARTGYEPFNAAPVGPDTSYENAQEQREIKTNLDAEQADKEARNA